MLTNLSHHFCNMLHHTTACCTICHVLLCGVNIYLLKPDCSACTYYCKTACRSEVAVEYGFELLKVSIVWRQASADFVWPLPLHMVQIPRHAQSSDGVEFAVVYQAVVSAARHRHPRHQVPVVQQGHVAPYISHHHTRLCATWDIWGLGRLQWVCRGITNFARTFWKTQAEWSSYKRDASI